MSSHKASLKSRAGGRAVLHPGRINPENIFLPSLDPTEKKSGATGVQRPGKFFAGDF
jgi:hypothetical protein